MPKKSLLPPLSFGIIAESLRTAGLNYRQSCTVAYRHLNTSSVGTYRYDGRRQDLLIHGCVKNEIRYDVPVVFQVIRVRCRPTR